MEVTIKNSELLQLVKIDLCALCRHFLNKAGCINYDLARMYIRNSCDVQEVIFFIRSEETVTCR